jgi:hypothetical protein
MSIVYRNASGDSVSMVAPSEKSPRLKEAHLYSSYNHCSCGPAEGHQTARQAACRHCACSPAHAHTVATGIELGPKTFGPHHWGAVCFKQHVLSDIEQPRHDRARGQNALLSIQNSWIVYSIVSVTQHIECAPQARNERHVQPILPMHTSMSPCKAKRRCVPA